MNLIEKWKFRKLINYDYSNGIEGLYLQLEKLKKNNNFNNFDRKQRQFLQLLNGLEKNKSGIKITKKNDVFSAFAGRGEIVINDLNTKKNQIEILFKSQYKELLFIIGIFCFMLLLYIPFIILGMFGKYWIFILFVSCVIIFTLKVFLLKNDISKLEKEFNNLLEQIE